MVIVAHNLWRAHHHAKVANLPADSLALMHLQLYDAVLSADPELEEAAAAIAQEQAEARAPSPAAARPQVGCIRACLRLL